MKSSDIPKATGRRIPLYYRYLKFLSESGKKRVSSAELSDGLQVDSATIRRDFSYFGELGKRGYGYDVDTLMNFFAKILNDDRLSNVGLIGIGNLGTALLKFKFHRNNNIRISAAFDTDPSLIGTIHEGVPVYSMDDLKEQFEAHQIEIAIVTVPANDAQMVSNQLVEAGIQGILNFTAVRLSVPDDVIVQSVDLTTELQTLIYFLNEKRE